MDYCSLHILGAVRIVAEFSLTETAAKLGAALGDIRFVEDPPGTCDEFPSFRAFAAGFSFILLGIPDPAEQICDESITDFTLQISLAIQSERAREPCDASAYFANLVVQRSNLRISISRA